MINNLKSQAVKALLLLTFVMASQLVLASGMCGGSQYVPDDNGLPWPWSRALAITLRDLQGTWSTPNGECKDWFYFEIANDEAGDQVVAITQFNPSTCAKVATGVGYQNGHAIYGQMVGHNGKTFDLTVQAFSASDVDRTTQIMSFTTAARRSHGGVSFESNSVVMALSLFPLGQSDELSADMITRESTGSSCGF